MTMDVIYARMSEDKAGAGLGIDRQVREVREAFNLPADTPVYSDNDISATSGKPRPAYLRLTKDMRAGKVKRVNVWHTDRLWRQPRELEDFIEAQETHGIATRAKQAGLADLSTPTGRTMARIGVAIARQEMELKSERQKSANLQRAQSGDVGWTRRPYGYDKRDGRIVTVPGEARELRRAAKRVLAGDTVASVVRDLNGRGVSTSTGGKWTQTALTRLLLSPRHAGRAVSNGQDHGAGQWSAIFDADTAERLRVVLRDPARRTAPASVAVKYLLTGLLTCGVEGCGRPLYAMPRGVGSKRWMAYACRTPHLSRRLDLIDDAVSALVVARMGQPDAAKLLAPATDVLALQREAAGLRKRRGSLARMVAGGVLDGDETEPLIVELSAQIDDLKRQVDHAAGASPLAPLIGAKDVDAAWRAMTRDSLPAARGTITTLFASLTILPAPHRGAGFTRSQIVPRWRKIN